MFINFTIHYIRIMKPNNKDLKTHLRDRENITYSTLVNDSSDPIWLIVNEFSDVRPPEFDIRFGDDIVCVCAIPTGPEFRVDPNNLTVLQGIELTQDEVSILIKIFNSYPKVHTSGNNLGNMRIVWNCLNCDGIIFNDIDIVI